MLVKVAPDVYVLRLLYRSITDLLNIIYNAIWQIKMNKTISKEYTKYLLWKSYLRLKSVAMKNKRHKEIQLLSLEPSCWLSLV